MDNAGKEFFRERYEQLGGKIEGIKPRPTIRVNTLKPAGIIPRLEKLGVKLERKLFTRNGYTVKQSKFSLGAITEYLLGYYYMQEAAAQLPVEVLNPKPTDVVLDCCAAPGGKNNTIGCKYEK